MGGEAAYFSLSRGEGGQNLIGPELGVGLGLIRTEELLAARRIEGNRQYFSRAYDFGYTRSLEETLERWPLLEQKLPLIAKALPWVGHVQTRSRGTVCGSLAHADPSSELPLCLALLCGHVVLRSRRSSRVLAATDFFAGALQTTRRDDELIEEVRFPIRPDATGVAFHEMAIRHGDFAIIAVGAVADADGVSVAVGGGADYPVVKRLPLLEGDALEAALNALAWSLDCQDDLHATAAYRRHLVRGLGQKTIEEAIACRS